jgi:polysaccharide pyruvyl transferase CsaB
VKYFLGGYYGMRNVGDDVLLYVTLAEVARIDAAARFTIVSQLRETIPPGVFATTTPGSRRFENVRQMHAHDVWLFGGGGLLQDSAARSRKYLIRLRHAARLIKLMRRKIAMVGIGVGPLKTRGGRGAAAGLLRAADFITVRDEESAALAAEIAPDARVQLAADLAFLLPRPSYALSGEVPTLGVSLLPYSRSIGLSDEDDRRAMAAMADALNRLLVAHPEYSVTLFEFFAGSREYGDARVLGPLRAALAFPERVRYRSYTGDFLALQHEIAACTAFVGMRFHACLLAHHAGVPCLMIAYHPKCESLARRLCVNADAMLPLPLLRDATALAARLEMLVQQPDKFRPQVALDDMAAASATTFRAMADTLASQTFPRPGGRSR